MSDLIYLDPPFNSTRDYVAPIGSQAAGAAFKDTWALDDVDLAWHGEIAEQNPAVYDVIHAAGVAHGASMQSYLIMMASGSWRCIRHRAERGGSAPRPAGLRDFFNSLKEPPWLYSEGFRPGIRAFHANVDLMLTAFVTGVLVEGFSTLIAKSFKMTGRVASTKRRLQ